MINIIDKSKCCGCTACVQCCPKQCIVLKEDNEGFLYPEVNIEQCINCNLCTKVCPVIYPFKEKYPQKTYACINPNNEIRINSSSGGIFSLIAEKVIQNNGIVFGAIFDSQWQVIHSYTKDINSLYKFQGSKYVQSFIGDSYQKIKLLLENNTIVLFVGTPCQVSGLLHYLRKDYHNLITVDFSCHGVASPKVWSLYLNELCSKHCIEIHNIKHINFRDKQYSWTKFCFSIKYFNSKNNLIETFLEIHNNNIFMKGFLSNLYLRPSCYKCPTKNGRSQSDITIADYWGIQNIFPEMNDEKGVSLVLINTEKGKSFFPITQTIFRESNYENARQYNEGLKGCAITPENRESFFAKIDNSKSIISLVQKLYKPNIKKRIQRRIKKFINKLTSI
jgi:NADPH:quinone reductase